ncbi:hypothetical protein CH275_09865 [Rhodococcus sp. 06-235-1A]|uniref:hypothetical protein n=1 Tax=Rhodococcus sp. 06-235-1A TaxID=2022508 RepID=UPI000B9A5098|nr:hypothetical protein [Rhodococcus sp. 06-235-1A]OZD06516.1 hypothetical protein CH275_09865 [Rhodococcus sp. 06-235-1A]
MLVLQILATLFCFIAAGQLLTAGAAKTGNFRLVTIRAGSQTTAIAIILLDFAVGVWAAVGQPSAAFLLWGLAAFYGSGAVYKSFVVLSPNREYCACTIANKQTEGVDVCANLIMASGAAALAATGVNRPTWSSVAGAAVLVAFAVVHLRRSVAQVRVQRWSF